MLPDATATKSLLAAAGLESDIEESTLGLAVHVPAATAGDVLRVLRDSDMDFRMLVDLMGTDTTREIQITYHLRSLARELEVYVKSSVPYGGKLISVWNVFASALMPERETAELFGLHLAGHPNPKRLLTTDGVEPLLLKSVPIRTAQEVRNR